MTSLEELERRKKELELKREIAWMEREDHAVASVTNAWKWALAVGLPILLAIAGIAYVVASFTAHGTDAVWIRFGGGALVVAAAGLRWFMRRGA